MNVFYLDNVRGFSKTFIPLQDVNFLVGENSTGKSSILSLMKIFSSDDFFNIQFNTEEIELGSFDEIISSNSKNKQFFSIGRVKIKSGNSAKKKGSNKKKSALYLSLIKFENNNGIPSISRFSYIEGNKIVHVAISKDEIKYRSSEFEFSEHSCIDELNNAISEQENVLNEYNLLKLSKNFVSKINGLPIPILKHLIEQDMSENRSNSKEFTGLFIHRDDITWIAPIREKPRRIYEKLKFGYSPAGEHIPFVINNMFGQKNQKEKNSYEPIINFGTESGLFESIGVKRFGKNENSPFELFICINGKKLKISNVGYGVSQILPIIVDVYRHASRVFAIQQPEIHLHPKAQAQLGEFIYLMAKRKEKKFLVETHSDFIIDRFRLNLNRDFKKKSSSKKQPTAQILFFEKNKEGNKVYIISIDEKGKYSDEQPPGFKSFFIREELMLINMDSV